MRKMKCRNLLIGLTLSVGLFISSCDKNDLSPENDQLPVAENKEGMTKLGSQLENPFSVENMTKAYSNLKSANSETPEIVIETTHLYIRFLPKNFDELSLLKNDSTIVLYETPMDYEITEPGIFYHDPGLPDTAITWQYCAVEVSKTLPNVSYELLSRLYLPPSTDDDNLKSTNAIASFYYQLEEEALKITGNLNSSNQLKSLKSSRWRPAGRIRVWDDFVSDYVAMEGVEVRARRWFTTHKGKTNSQGYYSCDGTFKRDANYSIDWDRYNFSIRSGTIGQATYDGPKKDGNWNLDIKGGRSQFYATIFRAAHHYYYGNINGLKRPPENSFWKPQMKIAAMYETNNDINGVHAAWKRVFGILNWIKIYNPNNSSREIYATTIHELAHASHWDIDHSDFNDSELIVKESWARGVQWSLTRIDRKSVV